MAVNLSPLGGVAAQFFNNDGVPLSGGLIYTYLAGTNTPTSTYTTGAGTIAHSNPIVLDSAGRVPTGEIWLTDGVAYKFVIKDAQNNLIGTYDNIVGINSNFVNYTASQEIQTATAGQTVFTLTTMAYQPGTNSLSVFVDGVNQYGPGAQYAFVETSSTSVTFASGLHVGASVKFTTAVINNIGGVDASQVTYDPPFTGSVATNVEAKLSEYVSVKDFGAVGDGVTDDTAAVQAAIDSLPNNAQDGCGGAIFFPNGVYAITAQINITNKSNVRLVGEGFSGSYNSTDYGVTLQGNGLFTGFQFTNSVGCTVESLQMKGFGAAMDFNGCIGFRVLNCNLRQNQFGAVFFNGGVGIVQGNMVRDNTVAGFKFLQTTGDTVVTENDIGGNPYGIYVASGGMHIYNNMIFYSNDNTGTGAGIFINAQDANADDPIRQCFITNNLLGRNDTAIKIQGDSLAYPTVESVIISENRIHQADDGGGGFDPTFAYGYGIAITWAKWINVKNNTFAGMRDYAVSAFQCESGVYVQGNDIRYGSATVAADGNGVVFNDVQWGRVENNNFISNTGTAVVMKCDLVSSYTQNNMVRGNTFQSNGAIYNEADVRTRANFVADNLGGTLSDYVLNVTTPLTQVRHILQGGNQETLKNQTLSLSNAAWNQSLFNLGAYNFWVDASGKFRIKNGVPSSDTDGTIVGTQT